VGAESAQAQVKEMGELDRETEIFTDERTVGTRTVVRRMEHMALLEDTIQTDGRYLPVVQVRLLSSSNAPHPLQRRKSCESQR
jgi:hypothetical protein